MTNDVRKEFIEATFRLSRTTPWADFEKTFRVYAASEMEKSLKAPSNEALASLGFARALLSLRDDFTGIDAAFQKFRKP